jgi:guanine deaminase
VIVAHPLRQIRAILQIHEHSTLLLIFAGAKGTLKREEYQVMQEFMRRAIALAMENVRSGAGGPFAAVIVKDGRVLAEGANRVTATNDPTAHAEVVAIREACRNLGDFQLTGCDLYTTCEPCPMCLGAIYWARPARVFYACVAADAAAVGFDDAFIYEELDRGHTERRLPMQQLLREESLAIFALWQQQEKKTAY